MYIDIKIISIVTIIMTNLQNLLFNSSVKKTNKPSTHTKIANEEPKVYGGSYAFENEDEFYKMLYDYVFV